MNKEELLLYVENMLQEELGSDSECRKITSSEAEDMAEKMGKKLSCKIYEKLISADKKSKKK